MKIRIHAHPQMLVDERRLRLNSPCWQALRRETTALLGCGAGRRIEPGRDPARFEMSEPGEIGPNIERALCL